MNEDLIKKVTQILDQFATEELGNRLSQFALISLKSMILDSIKNYKIDERKNEDKKTSK